MPRRSEEFEFTNDKLGERRGFSQGERGYKACASMAGFSTSSLLAAIPRQECMVTPLRRSCGLELVMERGEARNRPLIMVPLFIANGEIIPR